MKQLKLPFSFPQKLFEPFTNAVKSTFNYIKQHPDDVMLAVILVMLMEIESDIEDLEGPST